MGYVASRVNQNFALRVHQVDERRLPFLADIFIDGERVSYGKCAGGKRTTIPSNLLKYPDAEDVFIFYALRTPAPSSAGSSYYNPDDAQSEIGTIKLELRRLEQAEGDQEVNAHPDPSDPCAVFLFRYRTLSFLRNNRLMNPRMAEEQPIEEEPEEVDDEPVQDGGGSPAENAPMDIEEERSSPTDSSAYDPALFEGEPIIGDFSHAATAAAAGIQAEDSATSMVSDDGPVVDGDVEMPRSTMSDILQRSAADSQCDVNSFMLNLRKGDTHLHDHIGRWHAGIQLSEAHIAESMMSQATSPVIRHAQAMSTPGLPPLFTHAPKPDVEMRDDPELLQLEVEQDDERVALERKLLSHGQERQLKELRESKKRDVKRRFNRDLSEEDLCLDAVEDDVDVQALKEKHAQEQANLERSILLHTQTRDMTRLTERKRAERMSTHERTRRNERATLVMHGSMRCFRIKREL
ncbi:hypothetical protein AURDEDRAFT_113365 [Auricularia subglabra TFB-10046 SS5]|nr:hypothetical protein AURDEDRAFT_113365 [Auricularia subglabra TFB-10046 SS5]